ncbi:DUF4175 domain-containing protein [Marinihelvus fidelis]|uniref:DUF4175 domain-containing protein n=1 Tax=Marinihelvus fidelis TaxID=2613842 RepID=A0A5N0T8U3_9GAMM|nr:DUF4175 domain-containing protein [Marinihelvus fidelis]KAA9131453.1 DUF4175 domain-containing protein [Marinihelvus fidelis]
MSDRATMDAGLVSAFGHLRRRLWLRRLVLAVATAALAAGASRMAGLPTEVAVGTAIAAGALTLLALARFGPLARKTDAELAEHLNRRLPGLEESAQLLLVPRDGLPVTRQLQRDRVARGLSAALATPADWKPATWPRTATALALAGVALWLLAMPLRGWVTSTTPSPTAGDAAPRADAALQLTDSRVTVIPPAYTGLPAFTQDALDVELPEGSRVEWRLRFNQPGDYALRLGDALLPLQRQDDGTLVAEQQVDDTGLYRLVVMAVGEELSIPGIYTLAVTLDRPPDVRIIEPDSATMEIPMAGPARFASTALVRDDYGIGDVEIRASVAKGAGEGVKFRDEVFHFDASESADDGTRYSRDWDLAAIGMAPGDEVYFFVVATDNRAPEPNSARSDTVVVRWLDEAPSGVAAEGIAIDLMPDYFKSQRQIIIETEALIADRQALDRDNFDATSRALGQAQSDLKQRYGQYLGDEFGEGDGYEAAVETETADDDDHAEDAEAHNHEHLHAEPGHGELASGPPPAGLDPSGGADALVSRFGHAHGAAEIGPITSRNPVGMMKRAISNMWQAELHLLLSEPSQALPYEYEALKYLNLARQAERVYTRRLGFEPPPVSEERRLQGELDEVRSRSHRLEPPAPDGDRVLFSALLDWISRANPAEPLDTDSRERLAHARNRLEQLSRQRPALITHAATIERVLVAGQLAVDDCPDCLPALRDALWTLLPAARAVPRTGQRDYMAGDPLVRDYANPGDEQTAEDTTP